MNKKFLTILKNPLCGGVSTPPPPQIPNKPTPITISSWTTKILSDSSKLAKRNIGQTLRCTKIMEKSYTQSKRKSQMI